jgi:hypothetical protein
LRGAKKKPALDAHCSRFLVKRLPRERPLIARGQQSRHTVTPIVRRPVLNLFMTTNRHENGTNDEGAPEGEKNDDETHDRDT